MKGEVQEGGWVRGGGGEVLGVWCHPGLLKEGALQPTCPRLF